MTTSRIELWPACAQTVHVSDDTMTVDLADGRSIAVPLEWYPRLVHGSPAERAHWRLIGRGERVHWPDLDMEASLRFGRCGHTPSTGFGHVGRSL